MSNTTILFAIHHKTGITCERLNGSALSVASEAVPMESMPSTAFDESALRLTVLPELKSRLNTECLIAWAGCFATPAKSICHSVFLRHLDHSLFEPLRHSTLTSSPRAETVMCLLSSSGAYHRLVFSGLDNSIYRHFNITKFS